MFQYHSVVHTLLSLATFVAAISNFSTATAEETAPAKPPYSSAVVQKADAILSDAGLRRSGKSLQSLQVADLSRMLSGIQRRRRELDLQQKEYAQVTEQLAKFDQQLSQLNVRDGELNLQLARIAGGDVLSNNRLVALINANRTQVTESRKQKAAGETAAQKLKAQLRLAEEKYAEEVFDARRQFGELTPKLDERLQDSQVRIAIDVMNTNFDVPKDITAAQILRTLDNRLVQFEKAVFRESIPLDVASNGSLFTMASINGKAVAMVVDSGATLVTLPSTTATQLQLEIPDDAGHVTLALANGERISGRRLKLAQVRVGQFEAKNVDAVVLEPIAGNPQPLLGLSYLDRYKFELDLANKTLGLLRVDSAE